jgi:hypothetical protein
VCFLNLNWKLPTAQRANDEGDCQGRLPSAPPEGARGSLDPARAPAARLWLETAVVRSDVIRFGPGWLLPGSTGRGSKRVAPRCVRQGAHT